MCGRSCHSPKTAHFRVPDDWGESNMIEIEVKYDDDALRKEIDRLLRAGGDLSPVMIEIAGHLQNSVAESFGTSPRVRGKRRMEGRALP